MSTFSICTLTFLLGFGTMVLVGYVRRRVIESDEAERVPFGPSTEWLDTEHRLRELERRYQEVIAETFLRNRVADNLCCCWSGGIEPEATVEAAK